MAYLLRYDGTNDTVSIPPITLPSSFEIEIDITYYATSGVQMFFSGWTTANNDKWYVGTSNNVLYWFIGGTSSTGGATLVNATRYKIKMLRNGSNFTLQVDGVTTATRNQASLLQAFDRIGSSNESQFFAKIDLYTLSYTDTATQANNRLYNADFSGGSGTALLTSSGTNNGTLNNFTVPACWVFYSSGASQNVTISAAKQQDTATVVTIGTNQVLTVPATKQQDKAAAITIGTNQVLTVVASKQQDTAAVAPIGTNQVLTVAASKQQDVAPTVAIGTSQVLTVPATKQQDVAAAVSVAQVAPGSQPITVPAAKQQDVAGVVAIGTSQLITAAGTKQQDKASAISVGQSQIVSVPAIQQQDKAASVTVGTIQTLSVQPVAQTDTAARVVVGTTQLVAVQSAQQIDRAAAITLTQQPPITQTIDVRTLRIELTTPRFGVARNTPVYTAQLTTPRYTVARA